MEIGLVGLPLAGKTTFFNLLTGASHGTGLAGAEQVYTGIAVVPDSRVDRLAEWYEPRKAVPARIQFKDIPGVRMEDGAARAARLLDEARNADALVQVVRAFRSAEVDALSGEPSPMKEIDDYRTELLLADMDAVEKRIANLKEAPKKKKDTQDQLAVLEKILQALEEEHPLGTVALDERKRLLLAGQQFLSEKPLIIAVNVSEEQLSSQSYPQKEEVAEFVRLNGIYYIEVCAQVEMEIGRLAPEERGEFMADLGLEETGIARLARTAYKCLGLISFFTIGENEVKAWTVREGTTARQAAGKVHSDMERGFIRAEVFHFDDLEKYGTVARIKERGLFRLEGKDYRVKDGDIIQFRFNV